MKNEKNLYIREVQKQRYENLCDTLSGYEMRGIRVSIQGIQFPVKKSAKIMSVCEDDCYMPDIMMDGFGNIIAINFDRIALR